MSKKEDLDKAFEEYKQLQAEQHSELMAELDRAKILFVSEFTKFLTRLGAVTLIGFALYYAFK